MKTNSFVMIVSPAGSVISAINAFSEADNQLKDNGDFSYPLGLLSFTVSGIGSGSDVPVEVLFHGANNKSAAQFVARKFKDSDNKVFTIEDAEISDLSINDQKIIKVKYIVKDGGTLDNDGRANGEIVDPVGLGTNNQLADTGNNQNLPAFLAVFIAIMTTAIARYKKKHYYRLNTY